MNVSKQVILRVYLIYFLVFGLLLSVAVKSCSIVVDGREGIFSASSEKLQYRTATVTPRRGEILDANASPLVTSVAFYDVYMDPMTVESSVWNDNIAALSKALANEFKDKTEREYYTYLTNARKKGNRYLLIRKKVTNETRRKLRTFPIFELGRFKGGIIDHQATIVRKRPHDELLRRTLGYVKITNSDTSRVGLEGAFDSYLAGQPGEIMQQRISNSWKPTGSVIRESKDGYDLLTSIDKDIQEVAHNELENQLKSKGGRYGCAIVMDVKTGFVKAMVNLQKSDDGKYYESYNHAIGTREVPGSTFKLAALMAALEDGKISLTDTVNAVGKYTFFNQSLTDAKEWGYGKITIKEAFEVSSNVISKVIFNAYKAQPERFLERIEQFGLMDKTSVSLSGEREPYFPKPGTPEWWGGSLAWLSIGYESQLTPLQLLAFYNAVANNGTYVQPQFVTQVRSGTKVIETFEPVILREKICSDQTLQAMRSCLEGVMINGTGKNLKSTYFTTAGKTGTAQIANKNLGYGKKGEKKHIASFAGYFPADEPIYSCIVVIAAPTDDIYGASVSGTVFSAIANKVYATSLKYHKAINEADPKQTIPVVLDGNRFELNQVLNAFEINKEIRGNQDWVSAKRSDKAVVVKDREIDKLYVPNVIGMGLKDALYLLESTGLRVNASGVGSVRSQSIPSGTVVESGKLIRIELRP
jgi:cell division protein FtsI (penicillin-binding protein 3)